MGRRDRGFGALPGPPEIDGGDPNPQIASPNESASGLPKSIHFLVFHLSRVIGILYQL